MSAAATPAALPRWKRVLFALLPTLVMAGVAEAVLRRAIPDVEIRTGLERGGLLRPYLPLAEADLVSADFRVRYRIDAHGFREPRGRALAPRQRPGGPLRILALGDSFTEGYGVEADAVWTRRLEALTGHEVFGLARMGASPMFHVLLAREYVPRLRPEVVIAQLFDNDLAENRYRHLPREPDGRVATLPDALRPGTGPLTRARDAWESLALVQAVWRLERRLRGKPLARLFVRPGSGVAGDRMEGEGAGDERLFPWYDPARAGDWAERFAEHEMLLRQLVGELRAAGVDVYLAYAPHHLEIVPGDVAASRAANPHHGLLERLADELDVAFIDGVALFGAAGRDPAAYYFPRDMHWNAAGHALFAEAVATEFAP